MTNEERRERREARLLRRWPPAARLPWPRRARA